MSGASSLQRRLGLGLALGVTLLWLVATFAANLVLRHELNESFDSALQETAQRLLSLAVADMREREDGEVAPRRIVALAPHEEYITYIVREADGRIVLRSHDAVAQVFPDRPLVGFRTGGTHRIYGESALDGAIYIEVAEPLIHRNEAATEATLALLWPLALLLPFALIAIWWYVRRSLRPIVGLTAEIEGRDGGDLSPVSAVHLPAEVAPIAGSVNRLLDRLGRALTAERRFTANSAHELRTPIAAALAQTQRLLAAASDEDVRARAREIETTLHRLGRLSEKLMQLARAEGAGLRAAEAQDVAPVLALVVTEFAHGEGEETRLRFEPPAAALHTHLDPDAFAILMRNLIENALRHSPAGSPVEIGIAADGGLRVVNGGPALAANELVGLTSRFARGRGTYEGAGLGLAIAETIARGGGARLELRSPVADREDGFEARLYLPE